MRTRSLSHVALALAALAFLPLRTDGGQAECCNVTTSLASTVNDPVNGDESFFKLPTGPANVMLLLDVSGSMTQFPQCGDYDWDAFNATATCTSPTLAAPPTSTTSLFTVNGTCTPSTSNASLAWMESIVPQTALPDPGRSNSLLHDAPPWGGSCTGNACLFDPKAYFFYGDWSATSSGSSSTRRASDTDATLPAACTAFDTTGAIIRDINNNPINLGSACTTCMTAHGYFFYRVTKATRLSALGVPNRWTTVDGNPQFKGTFLNANPPKFVTARKVLKDIAYMDPASPSKLDQVRLGLTIIDSGALSPRKARLIVPLGPDKTASFPPTQAGFAQARQYIISVVNYDQAVYKDAANNTVIDGTTITGGFFNPANGSTPLASALFNIGQYFTSVNRYNNLLGSTACSTKSCQTSAFNETAAGDVNAPWAAGGTACSICWACQNNSVIIVTDGAPNSEITFPNTIATYDNNAYNAKQNCGTAPNCGSAVVPRVASWLHASDLRDDKLMSSKQALTVHTIGINMTDATAINVLRATANMGGGLYQNASDPASLAAALVNAINQVIPKENTFSAASANSLQTVQTAASVAYLTRFRPNQTITWEGHVFEAFLFDEFLNGCDPNLATQPDVTCGSKTVSADFNGDGMCNGTFLIDTDCDEVAEDAKTGDFVKKGQATPANLPWDAGLVLSDPTKTGYRSADETAANARSIFTSVNGAKVDFTTANAATLLPLMNISAAWCTGFLTRIGVAGGASPTLTCAQQIIHFVRGWDVLDQDNDGCAGPSNPKNTVSCKSGIKGEERDRANDGNTDKFFWKLGDVFHSSPAVETAPVDEIRCDTGYEKQCVATLHSPAGLPNQTPIQSYTDAKGNPVDAYAKYRLDSISRKRVVLVGANDGMLHAFDAGDPDTSKPADITGTYPYSNGTGEELWAFIPPDLLPRLKGMVDAHQYMVDGSVMLRDVWVDGIGTQVAGADRKKQSDEYRTVAIVGRRSGGAAYSALDVTDLTKPVPLWNFPEGCTDDARYMGESWADFAPRPPPIGPVRMASTKDPRGFEERWIVMINGGYDPTLTLGRVVYMLDAWTGKTLWRFTDADFKAQTGYGSGTSMFPVPAAVGLVDIGDPTQQASDADGFFDTATWGDLGGNLWVARFHAPGVVDATTDRVNNWFAARTFEQRRRTDDSQHSSGRNEFYYMTANAYEPTGRTLRTYLGSGNREQIMSQKASCGTDNLLACCQAGCTNVTATTTENFGACNGTTTFSCVNGALAYTTSTTATCGTNTATCAAAPGNAFTSNVSLHWECPGAGAVPDSTGTVSCDGSGLCSVTPVGSRQVTGTFNPQPHNRFYGVWAYGRDQHKMFSDKASALAFDRNRFTDVSYTGACTGPKGNTCTLVDTTQAKVAYDTSNPLLVNTTCGGGVTKCSATVDDAGWFYEYGDTCPLGNCSPAPPWTDEKTGSGATIVLGCATWGNFRPVGASGDTNPCSGTLGVPASYAYTAHYVSGTPNPAACGSLVLAVARSITAPPSGPTVRVDIKPGGQISYSTLRLDPGSPPSSTQVGTRTQITEPVYWLEVPRDLHSCRHVSAASCP